MFSKTKLLFFLALLLLAVSFSACNVHLAESKFSWLRVGSYAVYSLGSDNPPEHYIPGMLMIFDDCAITESYAVLGNYSWRCIEMEGEQARLEVEVNFTIDDRGVGYTGAKYVQMAKNDDLSFIKRIPLDQVEGKIDIYDESDQVKIRGPINIYRKMNVTVDLETNELVDENGQPWGKWALWIDPLKYPITGRTPEIFVMNWLNTTLELSVRYNNGSTGKTVESILGTFERYFVGGAWEFEHEFLTEVGFSFLILTYRWEPRTGIFLETSSGEYVDDILTQKLGIVLTDGRFALLDTNISIEPEPVDTTPPNIIDVSQIPLKDNVLSEHEVKVNATVTDDVSGVKQVILNYTIGNGTWFSKEMTNLEGNIYNATIPGFPNCTDVTYVIIAEDNANNTITTLAMGNEYQYHVPESEPEPSSEFNWPPYTCHLAAAIATTLVTATIATVYVIQRRKKAKQQTSN